MGGPKGRGWEGVGVGGEARRAIGKLDRKYKRNLHTQTRPTVGDVGASRCVPPWGTTGVKVGAGREEGACVAGSVDELRREYRLPGAPLLLVGPLDGTSGLLGPLPFLVCAPKARGRSGLMTQGSRLRSMGLT